MKRTLSLILAVIMVVLSVPMTAVEVNAVTDNKIYTKAIETPYFSQAPSIDGNVTEEEWGAPSVTLKTSAAACPGSEAPSADNTFLWYSHTYDSTTGTYSDVDMQAKTMLSNLTIKLWFRWDVDNYYMAAIVDDPDGYYLPSGRANIWNGDCLQFRVDPMGPNSYFAYKNPGYNYKTDDFDISKMSGNSYAPWAYSTKICNIGLGMIKNTRGAWEYQAFDMADGGTGNFTGAMLVNDKKLGPEGKLTESIGMTGTNLKTEFKMKSEGGKNYYEVATPWAYLDQWNQNQAAVGAVWGIAVANLMGKEAANGFYAYFQWGYGICGAQHQLANLRTTVGGTNALVLTDKDALTGATVSGLPVYTSNNDPSKVINNVIDLHGTDTTYLGSSEEISVKDGDFSVFFDAAYIAPDGNEASFTHLGVRLGADYGKIAGWDGVTGEFFITRSLWGSGIDKSIVYAVSDDTFKWEAGEWHKLGVKVADETVTVYFDGEVVLEDNDSSYRCTNYPYQIIIYNQGDYVLDNICFYDGAGNPIQEFTHDSDDLAWNTSDMKLQALPSSIETVKGECKNLNADSEYSCLFVEGTNDEGFTCTLCSFCGTIGEIFHKIKHVDAKAPTCTEIGWEAYEYCEHCDYTTYVEIPATHNNTEIFGYVAPTCTSIGFTGSIFCHDCKTTVETSKSIPATGHQNTETFGYIAPTCTTDGYTGTMYCNDCKTTFEQGENIPATGHQNTENLGYVAPTCTTDGYTGAMYCNDCKTTFEYGEIIPATGHLNTETIGYVAHTSTEPGYTGVVYCLDCGTTVKNGEVIPAGHQYANGVCIYCNEKEYTDPIPDNTSKGLAFVSNGDGTCYVEDVGTCTDTDIVIPTKSPEGDTVTGIGRDAFSHYDTLTSITIPDSVITIGEFAFFNCSSLTRITVSEGNTVYTDIDGVLFSKAEKALLLYPKAKTDTFYSIPVGATTIDKFAFSGCYNLTSVTIGNNVTTIGDSAFYDCDGLTSVTIGDSVTTIGNNAFYCCDNLTDVAIGNGVTTISFKAFADCRNLTSVTIPNNVTAIDNSAFFCCYGLTSITIPDSVTTIGNSAFDYCESLTDVYYGGIKNQWDAIIIGKDNEGLTGATIHYKVIDTECECGKNVVTDGDLYYYNLAPTCAEYEYDIYICADCGGMYPVVVGFPTYDHKWDDGVVTTKPSYTTEGVLTYTCACGATYTETIPVLDNIFVGIDHSEVTNGSKNEFSFVTNKDSYKPGDTVTIVASAESLWGDQSLITNDQDLGEITGAFGPAIFTVSVVFDNNMFTAKKPTLATNSTLGNAEYIECTIPTAKVLNSSGIGTMNIIVSQVVNDNEDGYITFYGSGEICTFTFTINEDTPDGEYLFYFGDYMVGSETLHHDVVGGKYVLYNAAVDPYGDKIDRALSDYGSPVVIRVDNSPKGLEFTSNYDGTCYVSGIGTCTDTDLVIPEKSPAGDVVTEIVFWAFRGCETLTSVVIPDSVTIIGDYAFENCDNLTSVVIPNSVTIIGDYAFENCTSLTSITIGNGVTTIGGGAFAHCTSLTSITIGNGVTTIGGGAFWQCTSLKKVKIPESVTEIGGNAFVGCSSLTEVNIPSKVTVLRECCFAECTSLEYIELSEGIVSAGPDVFMYCTALKSVEIPASMVNIDMSIFGGCTSLVDLRVHQDNPVYHSVENCIIETATNTLFIAGGGLTSVIIPDYVTTIGENAFANCIYLTSVVIPDSVTTVAPAAFYNCTSLTSVTLPDSVTTIDSIAFWECTGLTSVTIPASVTTIGRDAFADCISITDVYYGGSELQWNVISVGTDNDCLLDAPYFHYNAPNPDTHYIYTVTKEPTCTTTGTAAYVCSCGYSKNEESISTGGHSIKQVAAQTATCTEIGWEAYEYCTVCDYTTYNEIAKRGHRVTTSKAVAPTCTETGLTEGKYCPDCKYVIANQKVVPALGHSLTQVGAQAPTCTNIGWEAYEYCNACNYSTYVKIAANGHTEVIDEPVAPTCTETGLTEGKHCSVCDEVLIAQEVVPANGHVLELVIGQPATCTEIGWNAYEYCTVCDYTTYTELAANGHVELINEAIDPTCTKTGLTEGIQCPVCDEVLVAQEVIPALGHTLKHVEAQTPTCTSIGWDAYEYCTACSYTTYVEISASHTIIPYEPKPDEYGHVCSSGSQKYVCTVCFDIFEDEDGLSVCPPLVSFPNEEVYFEGSCTEAGGKKIICGDCGETIKVILSDIIPGHVIEGMVSNPTCTEPGTGYKVCSRCDYKEYVEIPATGHQNTEIINQADLTCTTDGNTGDTYCHDCDTVIEYGVITVAKGHSDVTLLNQKVMTCTEDGYSGDSYCGVCETVFEYGNIIPASHNLTQHSAKSPTCTEIGWFAYEDCSNCDYSTYVELRKYGHEYENGTCTHCGEEEPTIFGDANGDRSVDGADIQLLQRFIAGLSAKMDDVAADANGDGSIDGADVMYISRLIAGLSV